ncbi:MAG: S41 family peptidase [Pseudomonadota bacterium]
MTATPNRTRKTAPKKKGVSFLSLFAAAFGGAALTAVALSSAPAAHGFNSNTFRQLDLFGEVFEKVHANYVTEVEDEELVEGAIDGMLMTLDPHSSYLTIDDFKDMQEQTSGEFGGLGIEVTQDEDGWVQVVAPMDETPAARAGLETGDLIIAVDDESLMGLTLNEAVDKLKGPKGTSIKITIAREGEDAPFDVDITREIIKVQSVRNRIEGDDIGYIRVTSFTEKTESGLKKAISDVKKELGPNMKGLVLDLRNNPGGLLDQAIAVSDAFLDRGEVVSTRGRNAGDTQRYNAGPGDMLEGTPVVVLINGGSASASEIVAGALQDRKRATILGVRSFGKGSVQTVIPLQGGIEGALRLTTARYYTPSGRSIQSTGVEPDIVVEMPRRRSTERPKEEDLPGALESEGDAPSAGDASVAGSCEEGDCQLERALKLLRGEVIAEAEAIVKAQ